MKVLVTGAAGFIGFHFTNLLINNGIEVVGLDNLNNYYDIELKFNRLAHVGIEKQEIKENELIRSNLYQQYQFIKLSIEEDDKLIQLFAQEKFDYVCHLAAQAGIRYSITNPKIYIKSNIVGFHNVLECCKQNKVKHFVYASSSSVYGLNEAIPLQTSQSTNHPISLYAASKKSNELLAHSYSHLYKLPTTGVRFFTVYGPWGRPDMAYYIFTKSILEKKPIKIYNHGNMMRDFTYIDDIVKGLHLILNNPPSGNENWDGINPNPSDSRAPYKIYNLGNSKPIKLLDFIENIERELNLKAIRINMDLQPGDVLITYADTSEVEKDFGYKPKTSLSYGIKQFVQWYTDYCQFKIVKNACLRVE